MIRRRTFFKQMALGAGGMLAACARTETASTPSAAVLMEPATPPVVNMLTSGLKFPEGPAFDAQGGLWCTEVQGGSLVKLMDGQAQRYLLNGAPGGRGNGLVFDGQGLAWVADSGRNAILRFDPLRETWETILDQIDGQPLLAPNDLIFDALGNLLFTCPNYASETASGYVVCLRPNGEALKIVEGFNRPNGLALVEDGSRLVVGDTYRKTLYQGAWDASAARWIDPQAWAKVGGSEGPDGMALGADGLLYQAIYGDGVIRVINPQGEVIRDIRLPGSNPTNVAFDLAGSLGMVVTEAEKGLLLSLPNEGK